MSLKSLFDSRSKEDNILITRAIFQADCSVRTAYSRVNCYYSNSRHRPSWMWYVPTYWNEFIIEHCANFMQYYDRNAFTPSPGLFSDGISDPGINMIRTVCISVWENLKEDERKKCREEIHGPSAKIIKKEQREEFYELFVLPCCKAVMQKYQALAHEKCFSKDEDSLTYMEMIKGVLAGLQNNITDLYGRVLGDARMSGDGTIIHEYEEVIDANKYFSHIRYRPIILAALAVTREDIGHFVNSLRYRCIADEVSCHKCKTFKPHHCRCTGPRLAGDDGRQEDSIEDLSSSEYLYSGIDNITKVAEELGIPIRYDYDRATRTRNTIRRARLFLDDNKRMTPDMYLQDIYNKKHDAEWILQRRNNIFAK